MPEGEEPRIEAARLEALAKQYEIYVQWAERLVDRRAEANRFYVALALAVVGAVGFIYSAQFNGDGATIPFDRFHPAHLFALALAVAGLAVCYTWRCILASQRDILRTKFAAIHELEAALPAQPYIRELEVRDGKRRKASFSRFELRLPTLFMAFFALVALALAGVLLHGLGARPLDLLNAARALLPH